MQLILKISYSSQDIINSSSTPGMAIHLKPSSINFKNNWTWKSIQYIYGKCFLLSLWVLSKNMERSSLVLYHHYLSQELNPSIVQCTWKDHKISIKTAPSANHSNLDFWGVLGNFSTFQMGMELYICLHLILFIVLSANHIYIILN